ncbi:growth factor receptor domain-containing protein [Calocera cornea HHB12733]|uniref:Growth factor receptor domain-containing protein n=1 Tax=Calocera cornea HHB12733 TaxID=1353952 RepID=A0A165HT88_9BASI|nr:growth factor receptor domain-containing protein [Calocera cornea HHB12733]
MMMMLVIFALIFSPFVFADNTTTLNTLCTAGQCIQGTFDLLLGATLPGPSGSKLQLLPDQYTASNIPQLVKAALNTAIPTPISGFNLTNASSLPFSIEANVALIAFGGAHYQTRLTSMNPIAPSPNESLSHPNASGLNAGSLIMGSGAWVALTSQVGNLNQRTILWDTVADMSELPSGAVGQALSMVDLQYGTCSPPCSGAGVCVSTGVCACPLGFTGASCETCQSGFFGPNCRSCPAGCVTCDDGPTGSGKCLSASTNSTSSCNCLNGVCSSEGGCQCNAGWATASNGTACSACAPGFFLDAAGSCEICKLGCTACASGTGICSSCLPGFSISPSDNTVCVPNTQLAAATTCTDGQYWSGSGCAPCSPVCETCNGPLSTDCVVCGVGKFSLNGTCVSIASDGTCNPSSSSDPATLVANNGKSECDTCPPKCTKCGIPGFNVASPFSSVQCSTCLPGYVLSQGQCISQCPAGTFVSPTDNFTCTACDSTCSTCAGASTFCLQCSQASQFALNGACTSTCPPGTFSSSGACLPCHSDCATCSGSSFSQCSSCSASRPVMSGQGRCLPTCGQAQYYDSSTSSCQSCDSSCSSCSGPGGTSCLGCSDKTKVLKSGSCVAATCSTNSTVVSALGLCLSELITVPTNNSTVAPDAPDAPTGGANTGSQSTLSTVTTQRLEWWQILLMALGGGFVLLLIMVLWRRWARKRRALKTREFANDMDRKQWGHRLWAALGGGREKAPRHDIVEPYGKRIDFELRSLSSEARSQGGRGYSQRGSGRARSEERRYSLESISPLQLRGATPYSGRIEYRDVEGSLRSNRSRLGPREPIRERSLQRLSATSSSYYASTRRSASPPIPSPPRSERSGASRSIPRKAPQYPPGFNSEQFEQWLSPSNTGGSDPPRRAPDYLTPLHTEAGASTDHLATDRYLTPVPTGSSGNTNPFRAKAF